MTIHLAPAGWSSKSCGEMAGFPPMDLLQLKGLKGEAGRRGGLTKRPLFGDLSFLITVPAHIPSRVGYSLEAGTEGDPTAPQRPLGPVGASLSGQTPPCFGGRRPGWLPLHDGLDDMTWVCQWEQSRPSRGAFLQTTRLTTL